MLGWHISVYRQADGGSSSATAESKEGARIAVWQTGIDGLQWLDELVRSGQAIELGGNGYPYRYTGQAEHIILPIMDGPPEAHSPWVGGPDDIILSGWEGRTVIDQAVADECRRDEWLLIEAWDES